MKRMVMFSIAMLVVSSTAFAANFGGRTQDQYGQGGAGQRDKNQGGGHGGSGELVVPGQGGGTDTPQVHPGYHGGGVQNPVPGQNGGGIQPIPASALTVAELYMTLAHAHHAKAIAIEESAKSNSKARMKQLNVIETNINMELQKLNEARKMLPMVKTSAARTNLTPAQSEVVHNARMNLRPAIMNLRPAISNPDMLCVCDGSMTGGGNATDTPGSMTGGGNANNAYQTMNPAQSNVTNSARSQMNEAQAKARMQENATNRR